MIFLITILPHFLVIYMYKCNVRRTRMEGGGVIGGGGGGEGQLLLICDIRCNGWEIPNLTRLIS